MVYTNNGLFGYLKIKYWYSVFWSNMGRAKTCDVKWNKQGIETQMSHVLIYIWKLKSWSQRNRKVTTRTQEGCNGQREE